MKPSCLILSLFLVFSIAAAPCVAQETGARKAIAGEAEMSAAQVDDNPTTGIVACVSSRGQIRLVAPYIPCRPTDTRIALHKAIADQIITEIKNQLAVEMKEQLLPELKIQMLSDLPTIIAPLVVPKIIEQLQLCPPSNSYP